MLITSELHTTINMFFALEMATLRILGEPFMKVVESSWEHNTVDNIMIGNSLLDDVFMKDFCSPFAEFDSSVRIDAVTNGSYNS